MSRSLFRLALVVYLCVVLWLTLGRLPGPKAPVALVPLVDTWRQMRDLGNRGAAREVIGNVLLFIPLGFLLAASFRPLRRLLPGVAVAAGISLAIEAMQSLPSIGRSTSVDDLIFNTIGAAIGAAILILARGAWLYRRERVAEGSG
jgi:glycopeptide antibiotics resistance protein